MDDQVMQTVASGGGGILNTLFGGIQQKKNIKNTLKANKELAKYQYGMDLDMWNRQNAYNTPLASRQRLEEAGLNPALMYGTGSVALGQASNAPRYPDVRADFTSQMPMIQLPDVLGRYQDLTLKQAQIDNVAANTKATEARTRTETFKAIVQDLLGEKTEVDIARGRQDIERSRLSSASEIERTKALQLANDLQKMLNPMLLEYQKKKGQAVDLDNQKRIQEIIFQKWRNELRQIGVTDSDSYLMRLLATMLDSMSDKSSQWMDNIQHMWKNKGNNQMFNFDK